jgi:hypothetical protein
LAFQVLVGVQVLAGGVDVGVAEEFLHRDDVASALQEPRDISVASLCPAGVSLEDSAKRKASENRWPLNQSYRLLLCNARQQHITE